MAKKPKKIVLDEYEKEILEAYENGMLRPSKSQANYQEIARNTMKKNRKINIRISENDLSALQRKAAREGIPYQTLIWKCASQICQWIFKRSEIKKSADPPASASSPARQTRPAFA